jgi:hypothetical protein
MHIPFCTPDAKNCQTNQKRAYAGSVRDGSSLWRYVRIPLVDVPRIAANNQP